MMVHTFEKLLNTYDFQLVISSLLLSILKLQRVFQMFDIFHRSL